MRKTYTPKIPSLRIGRLRESTSNPNLRSSVPPFVLQPLLRLILRIIVRPVKLLLLPFIVFLFSLLMSLAYGPLSSRGAVSHTLARIIPPRCVIRVTWGEGVTYYPTR